MLDASALLAFLHSEPGADKVEAQLTEASISAVNWSEVLQKASTRGVNVAGLRADMTALGLTIVPFAAEDAEQAAHLWESTRDHGLSLGDRACLALGLRLQAPVLTADRIWLELGERLNLEIRVTR